MRPGKQSSFNVAVNVIKVHGKGLNCFRRTHTHTQNKKRIKFNDDVKVKISSFSMFFPFFFFPRSNEKQIHIFLSDEKRAESHSEVEASSE